MCNHVPGECLGLVKGSWLEVKEALSEADLPGTWELLPLEPPEGGAEGSPFQDYLFVHVTGIPEGLEIMAVSRLSAALGSWIRSGQAIAELNFLLPLAVTGSGRGKAFSPPAAHLADRLRKGLAAQLRPQNGARAVALIDSGVDISRLRGARDRTFRDYGTNRQRFGEEIDSDHDPRGHGTDICRMLEAMLPDFVPIASGRLPATDGVVSVLNVATAFAHLVSAHRPAAINLSLAPRDAVVFCSECRRTINLDSFHSLILPHVFRLAGPDTIVVMAAGNSRQISNARHAAAEVRSLVLVEASDSNGRLAEYSNRVDSAFANVARIFGGDGTGADARQNVFEDAPSSFGTSYAAPFVTAALYGYSVRARSLPDRRDDPETMTWFLNQLLPEEVDYRPARAFVSEP